MISKKNWILEKIYDLVLIQWYIDCVINILLIIAIVLAKFVIAAIVKDHLLINIYSYDIGIRKAAVAPKLGVQATTNKIYLVTILSISFLSLSH